MIETSNDRNKQASLLCMQADFNPLFLLRCSNYSGVLYFDSLFSGQLERPKTCVQYSFNHNNMGTEPKKFQRCIFNLYLGDAKNSIVLLLKRDMAQKMYQGCGHAGGEFDSSNYQSTCSQVQEFHHDEDPHHQSKYSVQRFGIFLEMYQRNHTPFFTTPQPPRKHACTPHFILK